MKICLFLFLIITQVYTQNTVGLVSYKPWDKVYDGYNLLYPHYQSSVYLLDNCGRIVHEWEGMEGYRNGNTAYITEEGHLIRTLRKDDGFAFIWELKGKTSVECRSWDNELLWQFEYLDETSRLHHDVEPTPYGTVLLISWDHHSVDEAISMGKDSSHLSQESFSPDKIIEYDPMLDSIIWEWRAWDHLIQDVDPDKPNFGVISNHPERININWENNELRADWMHVNSIDYHPELDQIMINVPTFNEIWIIDHSTTTAEAASSAGGKAGKGGDLLWRWGNPITYNSGTHDDQKLFFQHDAAWAIDYLNREDPYFGAITIFNNQIEFGYSEVGIIEPTFDRTLWSYEKLDETYLPENFSYTWSHPESGIIYSRGLSSFQILPNGNKLICSGNNGLSLELNQDEKVVWQYITPFKDGRVIEQGTSLQLFDNLTFRLRRMPLDYSGFINLDNSPGEYLELNPNEDFCDKLLDTQDLTNADDLRLIKTGVKLYSLSDKDFEISSIEVFDILGRTHTNSVQQIFKNSFTLRQELVGAHLVQVNKKWLFKILK